MVKIGGVAASTTSQGYPYIELFFNKYAVPGGILHQAQPYYIYIYIDINKTKKDNFTKGY
jgi:hypothetical protein